MPSFALRSPALVRALLSAAVATAGTLGAASTASALTVTETGDAQALKNAIVGDGVHVTSVVYSGAPNAAGTFTGGLASGIGIDGGIILTSGSASNAVGPNDLDDATTDNGSLEGDADLSGITGAQTYDAASLELTFTTTGGDLFFNFVFASEEYSEFANSEFNDVFAFFLDGNNIALLPGTDTPVAINTVNGGNPFDGSPAQNPQYYVDNATNGEVGAHDLQYDGFTTVLTAAAHDLGEGTHTIRLAIADTSDPNLDSAVFIQAGSFSNVELPPVAVPEPASIAMLGVAAAFVARRRMRRA